MKKNKIIIFIILATIISKGLAFCRDLLLSYLYGISYVTDALVVSDFIPTSIFGIVIAGISTGFIPVYATINNEKEKSKFLSNICTFIFLVSVFIGVLCFFLMDFIVPVFASGFDEKTMNLAINFSRISIISSLFIGINSVFVAFLQLKTKQVAITCAGIFGNIAAIILYFLSTKINLYLLATASLAMQVVNAFIFFVMTYREGYRYKFLIDFKDPNLRKMIKICLPLIIGTSLNEINLLLDKTLASRLVDGGVTALNYANVIDSMVHGIIVTSVVSLMYPSISVMIANKDSNTSKEIYSFFSTLFLLLVPASLGLFLFSKEIIATLFLRGEFNKDDLNLTYQCLLFYAPGIFAIGIRDALSKVFYSYNKVAIPTINSGIGMIINISLNFLLGHYMGLNGLALATTISAYVTLILLMISGKRVIDNFSLRNFWKILYKKICACLLSIVPIFLTVHYTFESSLTIYDFIRIFVLIVLDYFIVIALLKDNSLFNFKPLRKS